MKKISFVLFFLLTNYLSFGQVCLNSTSDITVDLDAPKYDIEVFNYTSTSGTCGTIVYDGQERNGSSSLNITANIAIGEDEILCGGQGGNPPDSIGIIVEPSFNCEFDILHLSGYLEAYLVVKGSASHNGPPKPPKEIMAKASISRSDEIQVYSPVPTTLELPLNVSTSLITGQAFCFPLLSFATAKSSLTVSIGTHIVPIEEEVINFGSFLKTEYVTESKNISFPVPAGLSTFTMKVDAELSAHSRGSSRGIMTCGSNAGAIANNGITVGNFTGVNGGPLPPGISIIGLTSGVNYINTMVSSCAILTPTILTKNDSCAFGIGEAMVTDTTNNYSYKWSNDSIGKLVTGLYAGEHHVVVTDSFYCSKLFPFTIDDFTLPAINLPTDTFLDHGDTIILNAIDSSNLNLSYIWSTGETTSSIMVDTCGLFSVMVTNSNFGCDFYYEVNVLSSTEYLISDGNIITDSGFFFDDGGPTNRYLNNKRYSITICPETEGEFIVLDFQEVDTYKGKLSVFDGKDEICLLDETVGSPSTFVASASSKGCLRVRFLSNFTPRSGWKALISTTSNPPAARIDTIKNCNFLFTDDGGPNGHHSTGDFEVYHICPDNIGTEVVSIDFFEVYLHANAILMVYDGMGVNCMLDRGVTGPKQFTASTKFGGCLTVIFKSGSLANSGWKANVTCTNTIIYPPDACQCDASPESTNTCDDAPLISSSASICGQASFLHTIDLSGDLENAFSKTIDNNSFYKFVADSSTAEIGYNWKGGLAILCNDGFQLVVFSVNGPCNSNTADWEEIAYLGTFPHIPSGIFTINGLNPGQTYYLMTDGKYGNECQFSLNVISGIAKCPLNANYETLSCQADGAYFVTIPIEGMADSTNYKAYEYNNYFNEIDTVFFNDDGFTDSITLGPYLAGRDYKIIIEGGDGLYGCSLIIEGTSNCEIPCDTIRTSFTSECIGDSLVVSGTIIGGTSPYSVYSEAYSTVLFPNDSSTFSFSPSDTVQSVAFTITDINLCQETDSFTVNMNCSGPTESDLSPVLKILPSNVSGLSQVGVAMEIFEVNNMDTDGSLVKVRIPSDPRILFIWDPFLTFVAFTPVQNSEWNYLGDNGIFHSWDYSGSSISQKSAFGFIAFYDPQGTEGQTTITGTIVPFSGGEINLGNNSDSESLIYFD